MSCGYYDVAKHMFISDPMDKFGNKIKDVLTVQSKEVLQDLVV